MCFKPIMKRKFRNNLIVVVVLHLLLLAYPLISKTFHVHHGSPHHHEFTTSENIDRTEDPCPVCDFEFYNFISTTPAHHFEAQSVIKIYLNPIPEIVFTPLVRYFSLRAPPIA